MPIRTCQYADEEDYTCFNLVEGNTIYCASHNKQLRDEAKAERKEKERFQKFKSKPKKVYAKPNKVSEKRKVLNAEYSILAMLFKVNNPDCKARIENVCTGKTEDVHHAKGRTGELLMDQDYFVPVCRACHQWVELHPKEAQKKGLSFLRLTI